MAPPNDLAPPAELVEKHASDPRGPQPVPTGLVSVVVPCAGQLEFTSMCVPALLRFTRKPFDLVFLDAGSLDGTREYLAGVTAAAPVRVEVIRTGPDARASKPNFQTRGDAVVLLSNDTIVTEGWLDRLLGVARSDPKIGMVAPMSNYAPEPQLVSSVPYRLGTTRDRPPIRDHELGAILQQVQQVNAFARTLRDRHAGKSCEVASLGGGCVLVKRDVLKTIGFALALSPLGFFDTSALSQRVTQAGYRLACCQDAYVHHFASRSLVSRSPNPTGQP
jgi:GT2 family glycosyltransferase